jgi:hypothetical protein
MSEANYNLFLQRLWRRRELRWLALAAGTGLVLGLVLSLILGGHSAQQVNISTGDAKMVRDLPYEDLMQILISSEIWGRGPAPGVAPDATEEPVEEEVPLPDRPGVFRHLELVAILRTPSLAAVLQPVKMPETLRGDMLSLPNDAGLYQLRLGEEVAKGWRVSGMTDTYLEIASVEHDEQVEYRLFAWSP